MALRKAEMTDMRPSGGGKTRLTFSRRRAASSAITASSCPTRAAPAS